MMDKAATSNRSSTRPPVNRSKSGGSARAASRSSPKPRIEKRREKRVPLEQPVAVEVSCDGVIWKFGSVLNISRSGAMIETPMLIRSDEKILVRHPGDERGETAAGYVVHILLGDEGERVGIGVNFRGDPGWAVLCRRLLPHTVQPLLEPAKPVDLPLDVEISRDGFLWIDAQIFDGDGGRAGLKTIMLGKPGETVRIRFAKQGIDAVAAGKIRQVDFADEGTLASIAIDFDADSGWQEIRARLGKSDDSADAGVRDGPEAKKTGGNEQTSAAGRRAKTPWEKTLLIDQGRRQNIDGSGRRQDGPDPADVNKRFYQSLVGRKLDNYEVVSFISSGAMGGVFRGWDTALERDVALKVISWELSSQEKFVEMFFKEARFVSKLNHPNISHIYNIGSADGIVYYAMEFVDGRNLLELQAGNSGFRMEQIVKYLKTACTTMDYVWKNRIIHRDLKPANILVTGDDQLKIVDFGVAHVVQLDGKPSQMRIVGSPLYLSPETIRNRKLDHRSDMYSLGATFFHLIAGLPPYADSSLRNLMIRHLRDPVPSLKQMAPDAPGYLCDVIEKMMAKNPGNRFAEYRQIIECLDSDSTNPSGSMISRFIKKLK